MSFLALQFRRASLALVQSLFCLIAITNLCNVALGQHEVNRFSNPSPVLIAWKPQAGVKRYRLQIARDRLFADVLYDGLVTGARYSTDALGPGVYYWRVAQANFETGRFEKTARLEIRDRGAAIGTSVGFTARPASSWQVAAGEVRQAFAANSAYLSGPDLIAVNSQGSVFALDSAGVAMWTTRPGASRDASSVSFLAAVGDADSKVVVALENGIRGLSLATGKELWRVDLSQQFVGGLSDPESGSFYLTGARPNELIILDTDSGKLRKRIGLSSSPVGSPLLLNRNRQHLLIIPLEQGVEIRSSFGDLERNIKVDSNVTTPAVLTSFRERQLLLLGTRQGLLTIDARSFAPARSISFAGEEHPVGFLSVANVDDDEEPEVVIISSRGRVITVDPFTGKIKWTADEGGFAKGVTFADIDGDSVLDVLVPGENNFARGLSGRDGVVIWETPDERGNTLTRSQARQLVTVTTRAGKTLLIGPDLWFVGLRAVELPRQTPTATVP